MPVTIHRILQISVLIIAVVVAARLIPNSGAAVTETRFDMLAYLDQQIADQECVKDVRCWSSVSKFQMFAAGAPIEHDALGARIECYDKLLDSIWVRASEIATNEVSREELIKVLSERFPGAGPDWQKFSFLESDEPMMVMNDLFTDYSDTIESWRIIQSWVARQVDSSGDINLSPSYSQAALDEFQRFLVKFDIAILRHSREVAERNKKSGIDAVSMQTAFQEAASLEK